MTDTVPWLPVAKRTAIAKESDMWIETAARAVTFTVTDDASANKAAEMVKMARDILKAKEEERKSITTPLLAAKNATDAIYRPTSDALARIIAHCKGEIGRYHSEREAARVTVLVQSAAEIGAGIVPTTPIPEPVSVARTAVTQYWDFEVIDPDAVPRELCSPDLAKIKEAIAYADTPHSAPREVPGLVFTLRERVVVR